MNVRFWRKADIGGMTATDPQWPLSIPKYLGLWDIEPMLRAVQWLE
jgi:hypothetical protein